MAAEARPAAEPRRWVPLIPATWALPVLATLAVFAAVWAGRAFLIPMLAAAVLAVMLWPLMLALQSLLRQRALAALATVAAAGALAAGLVWGVATQVAVVSDQMPTVLRQLARDVASLGTERASAVQRTRNALNELDKSIAKVTGTEPSPPQAARQRHASIVASVTEWGTEMAVKASKEVAGALLQAGAIAILTFCLLCSGEAVHARMATWCSRLTCGADPCLAVLSEGARQIRLFAGVTTATNLIFGVGCGVLFALLGISDAATWGLAFGAMHFMPYAGLAVAVVLAAVEAYALQGSLVTGLLAAGGVAALGVFAGTVMTMWLQGKAARIDGAVVFAGTVFWSVIWGGWGLLLGPLMVVLTRQVAQVVPMLNSPAAPPPEPAATPAAAVDALIVPPSLPAP